MMMIKLEVYFTGLMVMMMMMMKIYQRRFRSQICERNLL